MSKSKENTNNQSSINFIRYLYQEGVRKGVNANPYFYPEIIKFVNSQVGIDAFNKFNKIDPKRSGIVVSTVSNHIKRVFQL